MRSSDAQPWNFREYRVWRTPWVARSGCLAQCLVGVPPSDGLLGLRNGDVVGSGSCQRVYYIQGYNAKFRCAAWEFSSIQGVANPMGS